jgi:hypothetical protein
MSSASLLDALSQTDHGVSSREGCNVPFSASAACRRLDHFRGDEAGVGSVFQEKLLVHTPTLIRSRLGEADSLRPPYSSSG